MLGQYEELVLRQLFDKPGYPRIVQVLENLPDKNHFSIGKRVFGHLQHDKLDAKACENALVSLDEFRHHVTSDIACALPPQLAPHVKVTAPKINYVEFVWHRSEKAADRFNVAMNDLGTVRSGARVEIAGATAPPCMRCIDR